MRLDRSRMCIGAALVAVSALLLLASLSAALNADAPAQSATTPRDGADATTGGVQLGATLSIEALGLKLDRSAAIDPPAARDAPLPGFSVERDESVAPEAIPLKADLGLDLAIGTHAERDAPAAGDVSTQDAGARVLATPGDLTLAAVAVGAAGLLLLAWGGIKTLAQKLVVLPIVGLYAKISRAEVFENHVRERMFATIRERPGIAATDLARAMNVAWGTTIYHLDVLEQTRMVTSVREGRHRRYFLNGQPLDQSKHTIAILQNSVTADVAERVRTAPGMTQKELALATSMSPQALHWHLARLVGAGIIRKEREGRVVRHFPAAG